MRIAIDSRVVRSWWPVLASLVMIGLVASPSSASRPEIERLLEEMRAAVLAADLDGYMKFVDPSDPVFLQEQRMWADDLRKNTPVEFRMAIRDPEAGARRADEAGEGGETPAQDSVVATDQGEHAVLIDGAVAEAAIEVAWSMPGWQKPRTLRWTALFRRGEDGWLYSGEKWNRLESDGVLVMYADGLDEAARAVADELPAVRRHVHDGFLFSEDSPIATRVQEVKVYGSMQHLQASIFLSYTDGIAGWNEPGESIKLLIGRRTRPGSLLPLLAHEYGHVATFELGDSRMPWWILEGVAELCAETYGKSRERNDREVRRWKADGKLPPFEEMVEFDDRAKKWYPQVYGQGHHMLGFISDRFGREARVAWLTSQARGASLDQATRDVLGLSFEQLDETWRESIGPPEADEEPVDGKQKVSGPST